MSTEKPVSNADDLPATDQSAALQEIEDNAEAALFPSFRDIGQGETTAKALELMAYEGKSSRTAAQAAGIEHRSLLRALRRPHVQTLINQIFKAMTEGAAHRAFTRMENLAETAQSEHVKESANKWIAGVGGLAPVKRVEGNINHNHTFGGFDYDDPAPDGGVVIDHASSGDDD